MSSTKDLAVKANDAAFESAIQKIAVTFQTNLINANKDSDKQAATDAAARASSFTRTFTIRCSKSSVEYFHSR